MKIIFTSYLGSDFYKLNYNLKHFNLLSRFMNKTLLLLWVKLIFVLIIVTVQTTSITAQNKFAARLMDKTTKQALIGATIIDQNNPSNNTISDENGIFYIERPVFPLSLKISYIGYSDMDFVLDKAPTSPVVITMEEEGQLLEGLVIKGQRVSDKQKADPRSVESMDIMAIKETPSISFYSGLGNLKGVDLTTASLGFTIINTRGFNSTSPVRSLQLIDGVDNQAPGLNFSLGNFLGVSELDILKVDLIAGASSTLYGPNAFNGVINMETKSPFYHKGLGASIKAGERNLLEAAVRWGDVIKNKKGEDFFGYKLNFFHLRADDWVADNYNAVDGSRDTLGNPGGYDAVNVYGDEIDNRFKNTNLIGYRGLTTWSRKGYKEVDLVDYDTRNTKANVGLYFRTKPSQGILSPEFIVSSSFGAGTTVYQGDNRFSLKDILFFQNKIEFSKKNQYFIRAYATHEDAGNSYDPYFTALALQKSNKNSEKFYSEFIRYWQTRINARAKANGYPIAEYDPISGTFKFPPGSLEAWFPTHIDSLTAWYNEAKNYADGLVVLPDQQGFYEVGTERFNQKFDEIVSSTSNDKGQKLGSRFYDKSALYHLQGEYKFTTEFGNITVGGSGRYYAPNSNGTIFYDTIGIKLSTYEYGIYAGYEKKLFRDKLTANVAARVDKNKNFNFLVSPAASLVWNPSPNNYFRLSFSSAVRNPTLTDQYLYLNVGPAILVGNLNGVDSVINVESFIDHLRDLSKPVQYFNIKPIKPEKVKSIELGARTTLFDKIYVDAGYYFSIYDDFIGYNIGIKSDFENVTNLPKNTQVYRYAANSTNTVTTQGFNLGINYYFANYFMFGGNYSWNKLNKTFEDDPIIPAFNTPEHKYNLSVSGRDVEIKLGKRKLKNIGFNVTYKWLQGFIFEGSPQFTGFIESYDLLDAQLSLGINKLNSTLKIGASNVLNNKVYQTYGGPKVGRMAYITILYNFEKK